jgi:hypothetical protein
VGFVERLIVLTLFRVISEGLPTEKYDRARELIRELEGEIIEAIWEADCWILENET